MRGRGTEEVMGDIWLGKQKEKHPGEGRGPARVEQEKAAEEWLKSRGQWQVGTKMPRKNSGMREKESKQDLVPY